MDGKRSRARNIESVPEITRYSLGSRSALHHEHIIMSTSWTHGTETEVMKRAFDEVPLSFLLSDATTNGG
jgi:hypothetical protein